MKIKPLAWRKPTDHPLDHAETSVCVADGIGGKYAISDKDKNGDVLLWFAHDEFVFEAFREISVAKARAQADFEARLPALFENS